MHKMRNRKRQEKQSTDRPKARSESGEAPKSAKTSTRSHVTKSDSERPQSSLLGSLWRAFYCVVGITVAVVMGWRYAMFVSQLHENHMYFSRIEVSTQLPESTMVILHVVRFHTTLYRTILSAANLVHSSACMMPTNRNDAIKKNHDYHKRRR